MYLAKQRDWSKYNTNYVESHHIVPKSLGGTNSKSNLVYLTAKEHFVAHKLLTKFLKIGSNAHIKMMYAFSYMLTGNGNNSERIYSSKEHSRIKELISKYGKGENHYNHGKKRSILDRMKQSESIARRNYKSTKGVLHKNESIEKIKKKRSTQINVGNKFIYHIKNITTGRDYGIIYDFGKWCEENKVTQDKLSRKANTGIFEYRKELWLIIRNVPPKRRPFSEIMLEYTLELPYY